MQRSRILSTAIVGLIGAIIGSFSMMLFASTHFAGVASPGNNPPALSAAPMTSAGGSDQDRIVSAVKRVQPSVVAINVYVNGQQVQPTDPFAQLFGGAPGGQRVPYRARASGSGFVFTRSGLIVTNAHVVNPPAPGLRVSKYEVIFANNDKVTAHLVSANVGTDLALLKVDNYGKLPPPLELADSDRLNLGQWAIAIGEPLELKQTVTVGVVSGFNRNEPVGTENGGTQYFKGLLQTSAPINPGNSGGPLVDMDGKVIGVNQLTASPQSAQGIGFAIPSNIVRTTAGQLEKTSGIVQGTNQGFIGIVPVSVNDNIRAQLNYRGAGVAVQQVTQGSPADQAGLEPGDVIQKVNGKDVGSDVAFRNEISGFKPGSNVNLQIWSAGVKKLVTVKLGERPADLQAPPNPQETP